MVMSAYFYEAVNLENQEFKFFSSICKEAAKGARKCKEALIKIDD